MRQKALTLAVAALLAFGASGVVTASITTSPQPVATAQPADNALPTNHTVEVIDPHDRLSEQDVKNAQQLAWANKSVASSFENNASIHFQVEAIGDELQVYVAPQETSAPRVMSVIKLQSQSVVSVEKLDNVETADDVQTAKLSPEDPMNLTQSSGEDSGTVTFATDGAPEFISSGELRTTQYSAKNMTELEDGESVMFVSEDNVRSQQALSEGTQEAFSNDE